MCYRQSISGSEEFSVIKTVSDRVIFFCKDTLFIADANRCANVQVSKVRMTQISPAIFVYLYIQRPGFSKKGNSGCSVKEKTGPKSTYFNSDI